MESNLVWEDICYCYPQFLELGVCCLFVVLNYFISPSKYIYIWAASGDFHLSAKQGKSKRGF